MRTLAFTQRPARPTCGFTLVELLVALALFGILSVLAWRGLDAILQSRASIEAPGRAALQLAAAWTQLEADVQAARGLRGTGANPAPTAPHILLGAQSLALLRNPASCAGCWEGVTYAITQRDGGTALVRRTTAPQRSAEAALAALESLMANPDTQKADAAADHAMLTGAEAMRVAVWRMAADGASGWAAAGAARDTLLNATGAQAGANPRPNVRRALKIDWRLTAPWEGWVSKVLVLENQW